MCAAAVTWLLVATTRPPLAMVQRSMETVTLWPLAKRTTGRRWLPAKRCTTPRAPLTRPLPALTLRMSMTWAPTFSSSTPFACESTYKAEKRILWRKE